MLDMKEARVVRISSNMDGKHPAFQPLSLADASTIALTAIECRLGPAAS